MSLPSRACETIALRLPHGMRDQVKQLAAHNLRSMNSEIVFCLQQYMTETKKEKRQARKPASLLESATP
ncbi:Arc family DNA-binding protein [Rhizobium leguminosarum]|uniref:Arc family DNA-binding protein n=1 Tax=Rhizobium leguminosarum TaxID=384 RepID=UPI001038EEDD|nr:Arc family DNA-binding protein [Rhizobium leguminosarum]TBZ75889.1 Arc family DNA-binding protein [Rhizobium leguminosarum bv. viciae]